MPWSWPGFDFDDLQTVEGLVRLDKCFLAVLQDQNPDLFTQLTGIRAGETLAAPAYSQFIMQLAPVLEGFIITALKIEKPIASLQEAYAQQDPIYAFKKYFVQRLARRRLKEAPDEQQWQDYNSWLALQCDHHLWQSDRELAVALYAHDVRENNKKEEEDKLALWCAGALTCSLAKKQVSTWTSFQLPQRIDWSRLVATAESDVVYGAEQMPESQWAPRDGFDLVDSGMPMRKIGAECDYCVTCHEKEDDFCRQGFPINKKQDKNPKENALGRVLSGCPLDEKISEMIALRRGGHVVAALATIMIDNPLCALTGHRICNDCSQA